jgi:hypothetical protein
LISNHGQKKFVFPAKPRMNKAMVDIGQKGDISDTYLGKRLLSDELLGGLDQSSLTLSPGNRRPPG